MAEIQASRPAPVRIAFRISYLGDRFSGSQMQAEGRTVEGEFIAACTRMELFTDWRSAGFLSAGRTDRGVHARGQVCALTTAYPERAITALNWQLPADIWSTGYTEVPPGFHPRYDAFSRTYRYFFGNPGLDTRLMTEAAGQFIGEHDFSCFARPGDKNPVRNVLSVHVGRHEDLVFFDVTAKSFLWHMVRYMAALLAAIGNHQADVEVVRRRLSGERPGPLTPAPAEGLILWDVDCGLSWTPMPVDRRTRVYLDGQLAHHAVMTRICGLICSDPDADA